MKNLHKTILLAVCFLISTSLNAANIVWYDGHGHVSYVANQSYSQVVETAIEMFATDMKAVTGYSAEESSKGRIEFIELNKLTNKEFKKIQKRKLPYEKVIAKADAFYIGIHDGRIIVMGDNARGTAYGILELSRMAGVSPWIWWGDAMPERRKRLETDAQFSTLQLPSVTSRGISVIDEEWIHHVHDTKKLFELMLRLRANTLLIPSTQKKSSAFYRECHRKAADYDISVETQLHHPMLIWEDYSPWISTTQPGEVFFQAQTAIRKDIRTSWVASVRNPKTSAYQLSLFLDMAWNNRLVTAQTLEKHLDAWLKQQFGNEIGRKLLPVMRKFYELTAVCNPLEIDKSHFNALAFGNELERFLEEYNILSQLVENIGREVRPELSDAFFTSVKYPIQTAAAIAAKHLEAQESRHIARKESFHHDSEALGAAARSIKAWRTLDQLIQKYNQTAHGKWKQLLPASLKKLAAFAAPALPDQLSEEEISKYGHDEEYLIQINTKTCVARNAADCSSTSEDTEIIPLLGQSLRAVVLKNGGKVSYKFNVDKPGNANLLVTTVQVPSALADAQMYVSIDGGEKKIYSAKNVSFSLGMGTHTLTIEAAGDQLILDQWMLDFNPGRQFQRIPL